MIIMTMNNPKYSIIIPAHNDAERIEKALKSVVEQTFTDYELIVICDACEDNTEEIAQRYGAITWSVDFHRDGLSRNAGLEIASGEYILFMDSDDWWLHEFVLMMIDKALDITDPDILAYGFIQRLKGVYGPIMRDNTVLWPHVWDKVWKRSIIGETRFSNVWSVSDLGFTQAILAKQPAVALMEMPLYYYNYMREGSITEMDARKDNV